MKAVSIVGNRYGRLLVADEFKDGTYNMAKCLCDCGNIKVIRKSSLTGGCSKSCGCYHSEKARERMSTAGGMTSHPLYRRWYDMNRRCLDPKRKDFHHYGGRGISVCEDWIRSNPNGFTNFLSDMEASYVEGLELDRVDNNGNYDKYNCKWSTRSEQVVNSRTLECKIGEIHWLNDGEETLHLAAMAKKYNMSQFKLHDRIVKLGWTLEEALTRKHKVKSYSIVIEGTSYKLNDIFVTNLSNRAKGCKISTRDMLRSIFSESVKIFAKINGKEVEVLSNVNIGKHAPILVKDNMFVKYFKPEYNILVGSEDAV